MPFIATNIPDLIIFEPRVIEDQRGYFFESYNQQTFDKEGGINALFIQDNESKSDYGVIRGLHFQKGVYAQAKLVRVVQGAVLDVVVDNRPSSKTYMQIFSIILSAKNKKQLFIPKGFAHGFAVLEDNSIFNYKCDNFYNADEEAGIHPLDPTLAIDWQIPLNDQIISAKDKALPFIK